MAHLSRSNGTSGMASSTIRSMNMCVLASVGTRLSCLFCSLFALPFTEDKSNQHTASSCSPSAWCLQEMVKWRWAHSSTTHFSGSSGNSCICAMRRERGNIHRSSHLAPKNLFRGGTKNINGAEKEELKTLLNLNVSLAIQRHSHPWEQLWKHRCINVGKDH